MPPTMIELNSMKWRDSDGTIREVSIIDECTTQNLGEDFRIIFGIEEYKMSQLVRKLPSAFCRAVLQRWYTEGSSPLEAYPIGWKGLLLALDKLHLKDLSKKVETALLQSVS